MLMRWIAVCALSAVLVIAPTAQPRAQVSAVLLKCTKSLTVAIACIIIDGGVKKVVDVGLDKLIEIAFGRKPQPDDFKLSTALLRDVEESGIEWSKLQEFLISVYKAGTPRDSTEARAQIGRSCNANWQPICGPLGVARPRETLPVCSTLATEQACIGSNLCTWKGGACADQGGTKELFKR